MYQQHSLKRYICTGFKNKPMNEPSQIVLCTKGYSVLSDTYILDSLAHDPRMN